MKLQRTILAVSVLLAAATGAGCMSPEEDPADTVEPTETTPGTTVAGGEPTGEPANQTGVAAGEGETEAVGETTEGGEATEGEETTQGAETTEDEGEG